jgi:hypothetical protein
MSRFAFCHSCQDLIALELSAGCADYFTVTLPGHFHAGFWILTSAAAHLDGDHDTVDGSNAERLFWRGPAQYASHTLATDSS